MGLDGRQEKRVQTAVAVCLTSSKEPHSTERTCTENISPHGARVATKRAWQPGEQLLITALTGEFEQPATVVYYEPVANGGFFVGLEWKELPRA